MTGSKNRKQHFVPQHYLRHFCEAGKIGVVATDPFRYIGKDTTRNQCQSSYFYRQGEDNSVDDWLGEVESVSGSLLKRIAETKKMTDEELVGLKMLAVIFFLRTRKAAEIAKLMPKWQADVILKDAIDRGRIPSPPDGWKPGMMDFEGMSGMLLRHSLIPCWLEMQTLSHKFLIPKSDSKTQFFTSDHPVIILNPFLNRKDSTRCFSGFSKAGFQLIFPISPDCCLIFYDAGVYKVGGKRDQLVSLSDYDLDQVNGLQIQSSDKILLFHPRTPESEIAQQYDKFARFRSPLKDHLSQIKSSKIDRIDEFVISKCSTITLPASFQFCKTVRNPRKGVEGRRNNDWTAFAGIVSEEFDRSPGDIEGAMKRAENRN